MVSNSPHFIVWDLFGFMVRLGMANVISTYTAGDYFHKYKPQEYTFMQEFRHDRREEDT